MSERSTWVDVLRRAEWINEERVVAYASMALLAYVAVGIYYIATLKAGLDIFGKPAGGDYLGFWCAAQVAGQGHAAAAYDFAAHVAQQQALIPGASRLSYAPWQYPPVFLVLLAPFAGLPYGASLLAWLSVSGAAYVQCIKRIFPHPRTVLVALALPLVLDNVQSGQNGFLSAALLGSGLLLLERQPVGAGLLLGVLAYKPQLALLVPLALLAGGRWRALGAMALSALVLCALSAAWFGVDAWAAFDASRSSTLGLLEGEHGLYYGKVSVFSSARLLGAGVAVAWILQAAFSVAAALLVAWGWRARAAPHSQVALLVAAIPLATPWFNIYDLVILAVPGAWVLREAVQRGFLPWERLALAAAAIVPVASIKLAWASGVQPSPLVALALLGVVARRLRSDIA